MIVFQAHGGALAALAFSPDGEQLATTQVRGSTSLWSAPYTSPLLGLSIGRSWGEACLAFSPDGRLLARTGRIVRVWSLAAPKAPLLDEAKHIERGCFSPDGRRFVAHGDDANLRRWDTATWAELPGGWGGTRESTGGHEFSVACLAYHPTGALIASGFAVLGERGYDSVVYLWDADTGAKRGTLRTPFAHAHPTAIVFSPDGRHLAGIYGPHLRIWDVASQTEVAHRQVGKKHFQGVAFTPDGERLVTVSNDKTVRLWETTTWGEAGAFEWQVGRLSCVAVSPDGMRMAAGGDRGKVVLWDVD